MQHLSRETRVLILSRADKIATDDFAYYMLTPDKVLISYAIASDHCIRRAAERSTNFTSVTTRLPWKASLVSHSIHGCRITSCRCMAIELSDLISGLLS